jgi:anaerobic magnesium-protoporphyrin IX monomethyl ester cyclase
MIILFHPRAVKPNNRRFPLAILFVAATLEGKEDYVIVDGNLDTDPATIARIAANRKIELLAVSVMPGPQMVAAIPVCREFRKQHPTIPIAWGGYFPSLYTDATLNARYVDFAIRGQGEDTLIELLAAIRGERKLATVSGLSYKDDFGLHVHNADRPLRSPSDFPLLP